MALDANQKALLAVATTYGKIKPQELHNDLWQIIKSGGNAATNLVVTNDKTNKKYQIVLKNVNDEVIAGGAGNEIYIPQERLSISNVTLSLKDADNNVIDTATIPTATTAVLGVTKLTDIVTTNDSSLAVTGKSVYDYIRGLKGQAYGLADLDEKGKIFLSQLPEPVIGGMIFKSVISTPNGIFTGIDGIDNLFVGSYYIAGTTFSIENKEATFYGAHAQGFANTYISCYENYDQGHVETVQPGDWIVIVSKVYNDVSKIWTIAYSIVNNNASNLYTPKSHDGATGAAHGVATTAVAGFMSAADKTKLDGIAAQANKYSHPNHSGDVTSVGDGATTISPKAVTFAKMQDIAANSILGNNTASVGVTKALTAAEIRALITDASNRFVTDTNKTDWGAFAYGKIKVGVTTTTADVNRDTITFANAGLIGVNISGDTITLSHDMNVYRTVTAVASTTVVTPAGYADNVGDRCLVFQNGIILVEGVDYTKSGATFTLTRAVGNGTELVFVIFTR